MPRNRKRTTAKAAWCEEDLKNSDVAVRKGMSVRKAAAKFNIPFSTLQGRLKNHNMNNPRLGRKPVFTIEQEKEMASQLKLLSSIFYGLTIIELRKVVFIYAKLNKIKNNFDEKTQMAGVDWLQGFMRRNATVAVRKAEATSLNRISAFNKKEVTRFYNKLQELMGKYKFQANDIYNADETGITTVTDPGKVLAEKGQRRVGSVTSGERGRNISVMCAMSAAGNYIPPMFIFPRARMTPLLERGGPPGALYTNSKNGWINEDLFVDWLIHFTTYSKPTKESPVLLIIDNHASHISLAAYTHCKNNHIVMLSIPPHSSHRLQPLDVSFYVPLKAAYRQECNLHMKSHMMAKITPFDVASLFNKAYAQVANISKCESGFRATGIYPINPNVFTEQDFLAASLMARHSGNPEEMSQSVNVVENDNDAASPAQGPSNQNLNNNAASPEPGPSNQDLHNDAASPEPGPSNQDLHNDADSPEPGPSNQGMMNTQEQPDRTPVSFADVAPIPTFSSSSTSTIRRKKQHATILTATPMKIILEEKEKKKAKKNERSSKTIKKKSSKIAGQSVKRKLLQDRSEDEDADHKADGNSSANMDVDCNKCRICEEFGRNKELWYRCTVCGLWSHADCSGWDTAEGYTCDFCA